MCEMIENIQAAQLAIALTRARKQRLANQSKEERSLEVMAQ